MMTEEFFDGEVAVVAVYLDEPQDGKPTGEAVDLSFFLCTESGVTQLDCVDEPYLVDWMDWKTMHAAERSESHVVYEVDWMSCDVALDILPVDVPEVMYAVLGRVSQVELGEERVRGRQRPDG